MLRTLHTHATRDRTADAHHCEIGVLTLPRLRNSLFAAVTRAPPQEPRPLTAAKIEKLIVSVDADNQRRAAIFAALSRTSQPQPAASAARQAELQRAAAPTTATAATGERGAGTAKPLAAADSQSAVRAPSAGLGPAASDSAAKSLPPALCGLRRTDQNITVRGFGGLTRDGRVSALDGRQ